MPRWGVVLLLWLLSNGAASAQTLRFEQDSLPVVLEQARQRQRPVFVALVLAAPPKKVDRSGKPLALPGLHDARVVAQLQRDFLPVQLVAGTPAARRLQRQYDIHVFPTYLYLAPDGTVLHRSVGWRTDAQRYLDDIATFRQELANPDNLSQLTQRYVLGERGVAFQRQLLEARRRVGLPIPPEQLDAYVRELSVKALEDFDQVVFLHECGPILDSRAFRVAKLNPRLVDSLYKVLPLAERMAINTRIIDNTRQEAIRRRDAQLAQKAASFARGSWTGPRAWWQGQWAYNRNLVSYYTAVGDTARLLPQLVSFVEQNYLQRPADTVRRELVQRQRRVLEREDLPGTPLPNSDSVKVVRREVRQPGTDPFAADLNNAAWQVYTTGTRRASFLNQALRWSQRSIAEDPQANYYDTLAHLLYRLNFNAEAVASQQKAVELAQRSGQDASKFRQELQRLKARQL